MHWLTPDVAGSPLQMFAGNTLLFSLGVGVWANITNPKKTRFRWFVSTEESQECWFTTQYSLVILGPGGGETNPGGLTACSRQSCWGDVSCSTMSWDWHILPMGFQFGMVPAHIFWPTDLEMTWCRCLKMKRWLPSGLPRICVASLISFVESAMILQWFWSLKDYWRILKEWSLKRAIVVKSKPILMGLNLFEFQFGYLLWNLWNLFGVGCSVSFQTVPAAPAHKELCASGWKGPRERQQRWKAIVQWDALGWCYASATLLHPSANTQSNVMEKPQVSGEGMRRWLYNTLCDR